jgi:predicted RNase H-like nuclease (RuvC/YqgF family)
MPNPPLSQVFPNVPLPPYGIEQILYRTGVLVEQKIARDRARQDEKIAKLEHEVEQFPQVFGSERWSAVERDIAALKSKVSQLEKPLGYSPPEERLNAIDQQCASLLHCITLIQSRMDQRSLLQYKSLQEVAFEESQSTRMAAMESRIDRLYKRVFCPEKGRNGFTLEEQLTALKKGVDACLHKRDSQESSKSCSMEQQRESDSIREEVQNLTDRVAELNGQCSNLEDRNLELGGLVRELRVRLGTTNGEILSSCVQIAQQGHQIAQQGKKIENLERQIMLQGQKIESLEKQQRTQHEQEKADPEERDRWRTVEAIWNSGGIPS